jgi:deoxyribose-phosphate aldolase
MSEGWTLGGNARREELFMRSYAEDGARRVDVEPRSNRRSENLAGCIDHTLLAPTATRAEIEQLCREALQYGFASVCVGPRFVTRCVRALQDSAVQVCTVVGFPLGTQDTEIKALEARRAVQLGATEIDMVLPIGAMLEDDHASVFRDIAAVRRETMGVAVLKVILECALLDPEQIALAARISVDAGADFVKTSTGFAGGGATLDDVKLLRSTVGDRVGVKAAGGIGDRATAEAMLAAGANRLGASRSVTIVAG